MSVALEEWRGPSSLALDEIELLFWQVEFVGSGGPALTEQVNHAYATSLVAHFQRYCRAVHAESADVVASAIPDPSLAPLVKSLLIRDRSLDKGSPTPGALGSDFGLFGFQFWPAIEAVDQRNRRRKERLGQLCEWRNGITHGDISRKRAAGRLMPLDLTLGTCRDWRRALGGLAVSIDEVMARRCRSLGSAKSW